jgi:hypothetical protein
LIGFVPGILLLSLGISIEIRGTLKRLRFGLEIGVDSSRRRVDEFDLRREG